MKKILFSILFLFLSLFVQSQVLYSDRFEDGILKMNSSAAYSVSLSNNNLVIIGNGTAGAYNSLGYEFHHNGTNINLDLSSNPKLYFKAKATNSPEIRIDLQDTNGYVTNLNASSVNLTNEFVVYELDYTDKLQDGAYGGSCTSGPCAVDASNIDKLVFFANAATGNYAGTIEIAWLSLGEPLEALPVDPDYAIRYNQIGYFIGKDKFISINSPNNFTAKPYTIYDANHNIVLSGTTGSTTFWNDAREYVSLIDISSIDTEGVYTFSTELIDINFTVSNTVYEAISEGTFKYYYFNRASTAITSEFGGEYARNAGHLDTQVIVHASAASAQRPTGTIISSPKGWYDAGDYNKYIVNSGISTYTLLAAYEHYSDYYKTRTFNIPEKNNNLPDILDEIIWNLDWMLSMQDPNDGGIYHKLTGLNFSGTVMPEDYNLDRYVVQKTTAAALNFAAVLSVASRIFKEYETEKPGYSATLLAASKNAYAWAKSNPTVYYSQPNDVTTGEYGDGNVTDEFQWAATELFITTLETAYKSDINISQIHSGIPGWSSVSPLALISIAQHAAALSSDLDVTTANNKLIATATTLKNRITNSPMKISMSTNDYNWGSNSNTGNQIVLLIRAYELTNDESYLNAGYTAMDYILGRNGTGYSYVSGFGDKPILHPHHRISEADDIILPVPGMVSGGPNPAQQDNCSGYPNNYPASSFTDSHCSYASNEITINWNAPIVYALNALQYYQNEQVALSIDKKKLVAPKISLFPNPTERKLTFKLPKSISTIKVVIFDAQGKKILTKKIQKEDLTIDFNHLESGVYIVKMFHPTINFTQKVIKL